MSMSTSDEGTRPSVYLGYIEDDDRINTEIHLDTAAHESNKSEDEHIAPWLVNKLGGSPIFPVNGFQISELATAFESLKCRSCGKILYLIIQINSPIDDSPLDRVMQIYACTKPDCSKHTWTALRCLFDSEVKREVDLVDIPKEFTVMNDSTYGPVILCESRSFFKPLFVSVTEEPTGNENFTRDNLAAMKLASNYRDPDVDSNPVQSKLKNLKNYQAPKPPASSTDLVDFEKFQMERLFDNDKDMYRFYKRISRFQAQIVRYDWEGEPLLNSARVKIQVLKCPSCSGRRNFEFQLMPALLNYLKSDVEFDRDALDFSSVIVHSCSRNCSSKRFNLEDTYFMADPDSRIFNKVKQKVLNVKLKAAVSKTNQDDETPMEIQETPQRTIPIKKITKSKKNRHKK